MWCCSANGFMAFHPSSSKETPIISNPLERNCCSNCTNHGISIAQGPHQVAQKFNSTTLPRKSESETRLPLASVKVKSGAGLRSFSLRAMRWEDGVLLHAVNSIAKITTAVNFEYRLAIHFQSIP